MIYVVHELESAGNITCFQHSQSGKLLHPSKNKHSNTKVTNNASMNNGYIAQSRCQDSSLAMASLVRRLSCVGGEPRNEATAMSDELVTANTWNTNEFIPSVKASYHTSDSR